MCTAVSTKAYAGRNLDVTDSYGEKIIITPRKYPLSLKSKDVLYNHYAFFGIGIVRDGYPLYFDATNEHGLYIAGLNYIGNAKYREPKDGMTNLAPYELIPYLLSTCRSADEARHALLSINLTNIPFIDSLPLAELHFFIADKEKTIVVEPDWYGLSIYDNPVDVLTNNPSFKAQLFGLNRYAGLTSAPLVNRFSSKLPFDQYSFGMGAIGLPGDLSSESRFVRATFHKLNSTKCGDLSEIMHLLDTVKMPEGSVAANGGYERTEYTSAVDLNTLVYSYKCYKSLHVYGVKLFSEDLNSEKLTLYDLKKEAEPQYQ